jgi:hypothetical protein
MLFANLPVANFDDEKVDTSVRKDSMTGNDA